MEDITLIVGGGSGIGKACAIKFCENGHKVVIAGRNKERLEEVSKEIGEKCSCTVMDIRSSESIENMVKYIKENNYDVKVLINSAGINTPNRDIENMDAKKTEEIISTNLTGAINVSRAIINELRKSGGGTIIHIGSSAGVRTSTLSGVAYSATKKALFSLVRSINLEEAKNGIRASIIAPATVNTELLLTRSKVPSEKERKKVLQPDTIADIALFIATQPKNVVMEQVVLTSSSEAEFL